MKMENTGLDYSVPPVLPPGITGEAWLRSLTQYANSMRRQYPDVSHPSDEYLTEGAQLLSSGQNLFAVGDSSTQSDTSQELRLGKVERMLNEHTKWNTAIELRTRQVGRSILIGGRNTGESVWANSRSNHISTIAGICLTLKRTFWISLSMPGT